MPRWTLHFSCRSLWCLLRTLFFGFFPRAAAACYISFLHTAYARTKITRPLPALFLHLLLITFTVDVPSTCRLPLRAAPCLYADVFFACTFVVSLLRFRVSDILLYHTVCPFTTVCVVPYRQLPCGTHLRQTIPFTPCFTLRVSLFTVCVVSRYA